MTMRITWHRNKIRLVPAMVVESCIGCLYAGETENVCPRPRGGRKYCYDAETEHGDDHIWIEDTDEAFADYVLAKMTGELPEE